METSSVERRKLQRCVACYIKSSITLLRRLLKESCWTSQLVCNVFPRKIKNTLLTLELDPAEHTTESNVGSGERIAELRRSTRKLQSII